MKQRLKRRLHAEGAVDRVLRTIGYSSIAACGVAVVVYLTDLPSVWYAYMSWFLIVGGVLSALGSAAGRWAGEFMGLPLLISAMLSFALLTFKYNGWEQGSGSIFLLLAYVGFMGSRWWDVRIVGRAARERYGE